MPPSNCFHTDHVDNFKEFNIQKHKNTFNKRKYFQNEQFFLCLADINLVVLLKHWLKVLVPDLFKHSLSCDI